MKPELLSKILALCEMQVTAVRAGAEDALVAFADLRAVKAAAEDALKEVEPAALTEAEKYPGKTFEHGGLKWTRTDGRRAFKFDHLKEWADAKHALADIEERAKNAALQAEKKLILAGGDGEVLDAAIITYGKPSLSIAKQ